VTGVEVTIGNCFRDVWEILPDAGGNISHSSGKQFPIVTDNNSLFVIPHSNTKSDSVQSLYPMRTETVTLSCWLVT